MSLFDKFTTESTEEIFDSAIEALKVIAFDRDADGAARVSAANTLINLSLGVNEYLERKALAESFGDGAIGLGDLADAVEEVFPEGYPKVVEAEIVEEG